MNAATITASTTASFYTLVRTFAAPAPAPVGAVRALFSDPVTLSDEARQRLQAETAARQANPGSASTVAPSQADLAGLLKRTPVPTQADLSKGLTSQPLPPPNWSDFDDLLSAPGLSSEDRGRIADALQQASGYRQQVSNDPAVDLAVRKMKLDYIRDNMVPASMQAQADAAISSYVAHAGTYMDQMSARLDAMALDIARSTGRSDRAQALQQEVAGYASGTAGSQQYRSSMVGLVDGKRYDTPELASASAASGFAAIRKALLDNVATWPREQRSGAAMVDAQLKQIQQDWTDFVSRLGARANQG